MRWLLLRGLSREQRHWGTFRDELAKRGEVVCLDLPGTGTERARRSPASIRGIMEDVRARWLQLQKQKLNAESPSRRDEEASAAQRRCVDQLQSNDWGVVAVSLGGMVAMDWCARHPADFARAVLVNTSASNLSAPWRRMRLRVVPHVLRALVERDRARREQRILTITTRLRPDLAALAAEWATYEAPSRLNVLRQLAAATRFRAPSSLKPRVLVVSGAQDPFTDPACATRIAARFAAPLAVHETAGHDLATDDPVWLARQVAAFA